MRPIKKLLITAGPTREHLDPVRFITNLSTGEMGYALARAAVSRGCRVSLVSGPTDLPQPAGVKFFPVISALQMKNACAKLFPSHDGLIMTAAVCDFSPVRASAQKIPSAKGLSVRFKRTPDILASLAKRKGRKVVIGFCLETKDLIRRAMVKLRSKKMDGIVANFYKPGKRIPFGKGKVQVVLIDAASEVRKERMMSKSALAVRILDWMTEIAVNREKFIL